MGVEEWRIDWLPPQEEIVILLEGYTGGYPVLLEVYQPDGKRVYRQQYSFPFLSLPARLFPARHYRYEVKHNGKPIQSGILEL